MSVMVIVGKYLEGEGRKEREIRVENGVNKDDRGYSSRRDQNAYNMWHQAKRNVLKT